MKGIIPNDLELLIEIKKQTNLEQIPLEYLHNELQNLKKSFESEININPATWKNEVYYLATKQLLELTNKKLAIVDTELSRLEREKAESNTKGGSTKKSAKNKVLAFNNNGSDQENVSDAMEKIEMILDKINDLLFENSTYDQWEQILNLETPTNPIICKSNIDINCLTAFCENLCNVQVFCIQYKTPLASIGAFQGNKLIKITNARQFTDAVQYGKEKGTDIDKKLDEIFSVIKHKT